MRASSRLPRRSLVLRWTLHSLVALGLLALVFWRANPWELQDEFDRFRGAPVVAAVLLNLPVLLVLTARARYVLRGLDHTVPLKDLLPISILGIVAAALTPGSAGDLLRTPFFRERHDIPYRDGVATVLYERGYSFLILALTTGVAATWTALPSAAGLPITLAGLALLLAAPRAGGLAIRALQRGATRSGPARGWWRERVLGASKPLDSLTVLLRNDRLTLLAGTTSLLAFGLMTVQMWLIAQALDLDLSAQQSWLALGGSLLASTLTLLPLGLGTMDATVAAIVGTDKGFDAGAAVAVLVRLTITLPLALLAIASYLYLVTRRRRRGEDAAETGAAGPEGRRAVGSH